MLCCASSVPFPVLFNAAWRLEPRVDAHETIERADAWFAARDRSWSLTVRDTGDDDDLRAAAEAAGLLPVTEAPEMVLAECPAAVDVPDDVELRWLVDTRGLDDFVAVSETAYVTRGLSEGTVTDGVTSLDAMTAPHVQTVLAYRQEEPLATAQVIMTHGVALVCWVGTLPSARGLGLGELVTRAVTRRAFELGARFVTLQASDQGEPIYRRMGYEVIYRYETFTRFQAPRSAHDRS